MHESMAHDAAHNEHAAHSEHCALE
jgi:hypothetical protein